jgi:hypothetical protein
MPWRSWCYIVGTGAGDDPRRVALDVPSMLGTLRILDCMCDVSPEAAEVSVGLVEDLGSFGIADVQGPGEHLAKVRELLPWWMVADDVDSLIRSLPVVVPTYLPPQPPLVPKTEAAATWKAADGWLRSVVDGTPVGNPLLDIDRTKLPDLLADPLLIAAGTALDNYVVLGIRRALGRAQ